MCFSAFAVTWSDLCLILCDDWTRNLVVRGRVGERGRSGPGDGAGGGGGEGEGGRASVTVGRMPLSDSFCTHVSKEILYFYALYIDK